jgi:hypothetical protein
MSTDDDDILTGPVPDPDAEPTAAERAHARTFAELLDKSLSGKAPPAMSADDRALLEVATVIRATSGNLDLAAGKQRVLIEDVLRQAVGASPSGPASSLGGMAAAVVPIQHGRARRWAPWVIAGASTLVAAAAIAMLWIRTSRPPAPPVAAAVQRPASWLSRPTDPLIGPIPRERAGDASARIDYIFADRLDGFRERRLSRGTPRGGKP